MSTKFYDMIFPELNRQELNSMKPSIPFLLGLRRRFFSKPKEKVFVIGFHKTGTSSMGKALQLLGYRVCGSLKEGIDVDKVKLSDKSYLMENTHGVLENYDAFQDTPWFLMYEQLYHVFPNAKFILTIRDEEKWLNSVKKHFGNNAFLYHDYIYKTDNVVIDETNYIAIYNAHIKACKIFFDKMQKDLLIIDLEHDTNKWQLLCSYLGVKPPKTKFPYANKANYSGKFSSKLKKKIKNLYYQK